MKIKQSQKVKIGGWVMSGDAKIAEAMAMSNLSFICVDLEHSSISLDQAENCVRAIQAHSCKAFVRLTHKSDMLSLRRLLDVGIDGVIVPDIRNAEEINAIQKQIFYPPSGTRGLGLYRQVQYGKSLNEYISQGIRDIEIIPQIEHIEAINDLESMMSLKEVETFFIGPYDLSASLNAHGDFKNTNFIRALDKFETVLKVNKKKLGIHVVNIDPDEVEEKIKKGYSFIAYSSDLIAINKVYNKIV